MRQNDGRNNQNTQKKGPPPDLKCLNCGKNHYVSKCPTIPADKKKWKFEDWVRFRNSEDGASSTKRRKKQVQNAQKAKDGSAEAAGSNRPGNNDSKSDGEATNPGGGASTNKRALNSAGTFSSKKSEKNGVNRSDIDGIAEIQGVSGYYVCDGGCDRATINTTYAEKLAAKGIHGFYYGVPKKATLADGSKKDIIVGYLRADISLKTKAGTVNLSDVRMDIIKGPDKSALLLLGKVEESRLGLKPYAQQLEEKARANRKTNKPQSKKRTPLLPETLPGELTRDEVRKAYCNDDVGKRRMESASTVDLMTATRMVTNF